MKFIVSREALLKPLQQAAGIVERRQTMQVLGNVLLKLKADLLSVTATDLEIELITQTVVERSISEGSITVSARKLLDIVKALPEESELEFSYAKERLTVRSGHSKFILTTLPAEQFPNIENSKPTFEFNMAQNALRKLIEITAFSMAQQDVRYYLNGMLFEIFEQKLTLVATDGHRLALAHCAVDRRIDEKKRAIVPRKSVLEIARLLSDTDEEIKIGFNRNHFQVHSSYLSFYSKLVEGDFPNYEKVLPKGGDKVLIGDRQKLRLVFNRAAILSNEKFRGIRLGISQGTLKVTANNPDQEEAEDQLQVEYDKEALSIAFNVTYLSDVLSVLGTQQVKMIFSDEKGSVLIKEERETNQSLYVVMPMRI